MVEQVKPTVTHPDQNFSVKDRANTNQPFNRVDATVANTDVGTAGPAPKQGEAHAKVRDMDVASRRKLVNERMTNIEDLQDFLSRISQELKNPQSASYPPTTVKVADEIDAYIRKVGYEPKSLNVPETDQQRTERLNQEAAAKQSPVAVRK